MIYTKQTKKALEIAFEIHKDQKDRAGLPYIVHPIILAENMEDEQSTILALLHDTIEDSNLTLEDLSKEGFPPEILEALDILTHKDNVGYSDYIKIIKGNTLATKVKIADLMHNNNLDRLDKVSDKDSKRVKKYQEALDFLHGDI